MQLEYCLIDKRDDFSSLPADRRWKKIEAESTEVAQSIIGDTRDYDDVDAIILARRNSRGGLNLLAACSDYTEWRAIGAAHIYLARFFSEKLKQRPAGDVLRAWGFSIDDAEAKRLIINLVAADVGMNADPENVRRGLNSLSYTIQSLGLPMGDWSFIPMLEAFTEAQRAQGF